MRSATFLPHLQLDLTWLWENVHGVLNCFFRGGYTQRDSGSLLALHARIIRRVVRRLYRVPRTKLGLPNVTQIPGILIFSLIMQLQGYLGYAGSAGNFGARPRSVQGAGTRAWVGHMLSLHSNRCTISAPPAGS